MSQNGKGDTPRPMSVDSDTFTQNWEKTFTPSTPTPSPIRYALAQDCPKDGKDPHVLPCDLEE